MSLTPATPYCLSPNHDRRAEVTRFENAKKKDQEAVQDAQKLASKVLNVVRIPGAAGGHQLTANRYQNSRKLEQNMISIYTGDRNARLSK